MLALKPLIGLVGHAFVLLLVAMTAAAVPADEGYEQPGEYRATALLDAKLVRGPHYTVDDRVTSDGFLYYFTVQSDFGPFTVASTTSLAVLIHEIESIGAMKKVETSDTVKASLQKSGENAITGLTNLFNDPEATLRGAGQGISSLFNRATETVGRRAPTETEDSRMKQLFGVTKSKGEIATKYGVSIYSENRVLQQELDRLAMADYMGGIGVGLATSVVPGVGGLVLSTSGTARLLNETINTTAASELWLQNKTKLLAMQMDADTVELFLNNPVFSPARQTVLVAALETLTGAANRELFIKVGLQASTPEMAKMIMETAVMAAGYHKHIAPLAAFSPMARLLRATGKDGSLLVFLPTDHLIWSRRVAAVAGDLIDQGRKAGAAGFELWSLGTFSERARSSLETMGWQLRQRAQNKLIPNR